MASRQSTSSVDLFVPEGPGGPRARIEHAVRVAVGEGRLAIGARLPSTRALARDLGIARSTVVDAYAQLAAEGWIASTHGSATRVLGSATATSSVASVDPAEPTFRHDLRPGRPNAASFPRAAWIGALRRALRDAPDAAFDYGDHRGLPRLRHEIAAYLGRVRAVRADPERVVVCGGFGEGLAIATRALRATGSTTLAVEDPCLAHHHAIAAASGLELLPVPIDADGAAVERLASTNAGGVLLTPAHQQPLGSSLSPTRRGIVLDWARETGATVIEDDYDSEFRFDRAPLGALQGRAPDAVIHIGTVSKTLAPAVRLGWLTAPARLLDPLVAEKATGGGQHPILDQLALAELLRSGAYDRHVRRMRLRYRARRDHLVARLAAEVPGVSTVGIAAGLQALLQLPAGGPPASAVAEAAASRGLALALVDERIWYSTRPLPRTLVVGFGAPPDHDFHAAIGVLFQCFDDVGLRKT